MADYYYFLNNRQLSFECVSHILDDIKNCNEDNCTYLQIGYIFWNVHFERSLQNDFLSPLQIIDILIKLPKIDENLMDMKYFDVDTLIDACYQVTNSPYYSDADILFFYWRTMIKAIDVVNKAERNVTFLEDKLFTIFSTIDKKLQLNPKEALELTDLMLCAHHTNLNFTKIIQWGTLLLKPFENYDNLTVEEQVDILEIRLTVSLCKFRIYNVTEALDEMEIIFEIISRNPDIRGHQNITYVYQEVCVHLILRYGKYLYTCYKESVWSKLKQLLHLFFVFPFDTNPKNKDTYYNKHKTWQEKAIAIKNFELEFFIISKSQDMIQEASYLISTTFYVIVNNREIRIIANAVTVCVRFWLLLYFLLIAVNIASLFYIIFVVHIIQPIYIRSIMSPSNSLLVVICVIVVCKLVFNWLRIMKRILDVLVYILMVPEDWSILFDV